MTETDVINARISFFGRGRSTKDITQSILDEWRSGGESHYIIENMLDAEEYFACRNVSILKKSRDLPTGSNTTMSNAQIPSAFLRTNVQQKVNYALGKPPIIGVTSPLENNTDVVDPLKEQYLAEWQAFLNPDRLKTLQRIGTSAINKGIGWAYVVIANNQLEIEDFDSEQLYPAWADKAHTELDAIVWDYTVIEYINSNRKVIQRVEFWDREAVEYFIDDSGTLKPDPERPSKDPHMTRDGELIGWGRVPFVALKGTGDELPMLNVIRENIDAYDKLNSKSIDALLDDIDPIIVLENYSPELGKLQDQRKIMQNARIAAVGKDGKIYYVQLNPNITAVQTKLQSISEDIRRFGQAVMSQESDVTSNPSGVALRFRYQDLDTYINGFEVECREFICKQLKYFFDIWLEFKGVGTAEQWKQYELTFKFDRDMMINESQYISDAVSLMATGASQETVDNWNPAIDSHKNEQKRREKEQAQQLADMTQFRQTAQEKEEPPE